MQELAYQHGIQHLAGRLGRDINQQKKVREAVAAYDGLPSAREVADKYGIPLVLIDQALMERVTHNDFRGVQSRRSRASVFI
jgi:DNA transposition AAA+ family ATPase